MYVCVQQGHVAQKAVPVQCTGTVPVQCDVQVQYRTVCRRRDNGAVTVLYYTFCIN